jgi:DDE superfamily endonuclease
MMKFPPVWIRVVKSSACGENGSLNNVWRALKSAFARVGPGLSPPDLIVQIKAIACEIPAIHKVPISRWSAADLGRYVRQTGIAATVSDSTIWRWLHEDAIKPWSYRSWIFPRDPQFAEKAGRVLDLYERVWNHLPLKEDEHVISADEKTSIQARHRRHETYPAISGSPMKVEHEYKRCGALAYIAGLDVHRGKLFGRCEKNTGIAAFDRLVDQVMTQPPYCEARRVFWIVDNGSSHRGEKSVNRLEKRYKNLVLIHGPVHASWLNQIEIYFSILQRKVVTPNDFRSIKELEDRIMDFQHHYERIAKPFEWKFTRRDLDALLRKISQNSSTQLRNAA